MRWSLLAAALCAFAAAHLHHRPAKRDELSVAVYETKVRPHFAKIPAADLRRHDHAVPVFQPLALDPLEHDPSRR